MRKPFLTLQKRFARWFTRQSRPAGRPVSPSARAWRSATWGALVVLLIILLTIAYDLFSPVSPGYFFTGAIFLIAAFAVIGLLAALLWRLLRGLPALAVGALASLVGVLAFLALTAASVCVGIVGAGLAVAALAGLLGAALGALRRADWRTSSRGKRLLLLGVAIASLGGLTAAGAWLLDPGTPRTAPPNAAALSDARVEPLALPDPSQPGAYPVRTLFYGSGADRRRPEYGNTVDIVTTPVDGSALVQGWSRLRTAYWGFDAHTLPLNARVWYPEGEGPFPLVLILHGQHPMEEASDPGYAYLGELLASRGFIVASVDENFLNLSPLADLLILNALVGENDLRGWLLLEHLQAWKRWNTDPASIFYHKVDLDQIALIGHSRGGEAVALAAAFNRLPYDPDDASVRFDYGFNIRAVIGIAPVDGTTRPAGREVDLENVNYLVLHGAQDMDVFTFQGNRQYARVRFSAGGDWFKSAVYIYGANHGQFNTAWGRKDLFEPIMRVFNLEQLLPAEQQRQIAAVTISAFLEASLHGDDGYRAFFQDLRRGNAWLPETIYLQQYQDARTQLVSTYEEDVDLTSTTLAGGTLTGDHLSLWREQPIQAKWKDLGNQAVYLGWEAGAQPDPASYSLQIPQGALRLSEASTLVFSLADAGEDPAGAESAPNRPPIDLSVEVRDRQGHSARLPLSHFMLLQPQIEGALGKARWMSPFPAAEAVLQSFEFPLRGFTAVNPAFDPTRLAEVRFIFDRTQTGVVVLDDIGFRLEE